MDFIEFSPNDKSDWGEKQSKISSNVTKGLPLGEGFAVVFVRGDTHEFKRIKAMLQQPSEDQRGYYWSVVLPHIRKAAEEQGQYYANDEELHSDLKLEMMRNYGLYVEKISKLSGEVYREAISVSNKKGDRENTFKYLDAVINWAAEFYGIVIPDPIKKKKEC